MWTLVLFTMLVGTTTGGGAHSTTTTLKFDNKTQCDQAFATLAHTIPIFDNANKPVGVFRVWGNCIEAK